MPDEEFVRTAFADAVANHVFVSVAFSAPYHLRGANAAAFSSTVGTAAVTAFAEASAAAEWPAVAVECWN